MKKIVSLLFVLLTIASFNLFSQELDPLLKLLIEKKVLTQEEAIAVQKEYDKKKTEEKEETKKVITEETKNIKSVSDALKGLKIGGTYFLSYQNGTQFDATEEDAKKSYNKFVLKRGYLDVRKEITPYLQVRFTPDITLDSSGDYKLRMKFLYADFHYKGNSYFSTPHFEVGMVHFPWFDMEENINIYRMQDPHFLDRLGIAQTADVGMLFGVNFGEPLSKDYQERVSTAYPGKWGSFEIGIYNGGGYTANEKNTNKVLASRVSVRPIPSYLPGLQFHLFGVTGKGNVADNLRYDKDGIFKNRKIYPNWKLLAFITTYQHPWFNIVAQYFEGEGNLSGTLYYTPANYVPQLVSVEDIFKACSDKGYSFFADVKLGEKKKWSVMGRFDYFDPDTKDILKITNSEDVQKRYICGVAYKIYQNNIVLFDYQKLAHSRYFKVGEKIPDEDRWQLTLQIKF